MILAEIIPYTLYFKTPAKTSRNTLSEKPIYILVLRDHARPDIYGLGEIGPFKGLSLDDRPDFGQKLDSTVSQINEGVPLDLLNLKEFPSIRFGLESALYDLHSGGKRKVFDTPFNEGKADIFINGLVWMSDKEGMLKQVEEKIAAGFSCIKMKVGALDFDEECRLLEIIRKKHSSFRIELRVDANGAFPDFDALELLKELKRFELHSIEQPVKPGNWDHMQELCAKSPVHIALDEELIGIDADTQAEKLLRFIKPHYLIIKPSILGGFRISDQWIKAANKFNKGWWITSALESNIGLSAIAQYASTFQLSLAQGLGTGQLYTNNFECPLFIKQGYLAYDPLQPWAVNKIIAGEQENT